MRILTPKITLSLYVYVQSSIKYKSKYLIYGQTLKYILFISIYINIFNPEMMYRLFFWFSQL